MPTNINFNKSLGFVRTSRVVVQSIKFAPVNVTPPAITGNTTLGSVLTLASVGQWLNYPSSYAYQWKRNGVNITSATNSTYTLVQADSAAFITCVVTATNITGSASTASNTIVAGVFSTPFAFTANTNNTSAGSSTATQFKLPLTTSTGLNIVVDWGDATTSTITSHLDAAVTHTYASAGTYSISITGTLPGWQFNNAGDRLKILNIASYGVLNITTNGIFRGCTNLISNATDAPTITTADLSLTFRSCTNFNGAIGNWNTSAVTDMSSMFEGASAFNQALTFNTGAVTTMSNMFNSATAFNQPLTFTTGAVTSMSGMFQNATNFNGTLTFTSTAAVTTMQSMFSGAQTFNQALSFNTALVNNMSGMFQNCFVFNQSLSFNTANVTTMSSMFNGAFAFNQPLSFNTALVNNMGSMFSSALAFNQLLTFNTAAVTNMGNMFFSAIAFNQPLSFTTGAVTSMSGMFQGASTFNSALNFTSTALVTDMTGMFRDNAAFNQPLSFNTALVARMPNMFSGATAFDQDLGSWNVANVGDFKNFMLGKTPATFSTANLDAIYNGWSASGVKPNIIINFGSANFTNAGGLAGKNILLGAPNNWSIGDGGGI